MNKNNLALDCFEDHISYMLNILCEVFFSFCNFV